MAGDLAECSNELHNNGQPCPRTCELCGMGSCVKGVPRIGEPVPDPVPVCNFDLRAQGQPCPKTCQLCNNGTCVKDQQAVPVPLPAEPVAPMTEYITYRMGDWTPSGSNSTIKVRVYAITGEEAIIREATRPGATMGTVPAKEITLPGRVYLWEYWVKCTGVGRKFTVLVAATNSVKADKEARAAISRQNLSTQAITLQNREEALHITLNPGVESTVLFLREEDQ